MGTRVTIDLPDNIYRQVRAAATQEQRSVTDILSDILSEAFPVNYTSPQRKQMEAEEEAYHRLLPSLLRDFEGKYVAIHAGEVVDWDADEWALATRVVKRYRERVVHLRQVTAQPEPELRIYSPRFWN